MNDKQAVQLTKFSEMKLTPVESGDSNSIVIHPNKIAPSGHELKGNIDANTKQRFETKVATDASTKQNAEADTRIKCRDVWSVAWKLILSFIAGIFFGIALEKSRVFEPESIRRQMVFTRWIMLKMFLSAVAAGQLCMCVLSVLPWTKEKFAAASAAYSACFSEKGIVTSMLGPFILGCGMTLCGACPGMVLAQVGAWSRNSIITLVGVVVGSLLYGMVAPFIVKVTRPRKPFTEHQLHSKLKLHYIAIALPMAVVMGLAVFLMEWFIPWMKDSPLQNPPNANIATAKVWPPFASGILIGILQIPIILGVGDTLGGSSSYVTLVSQWVVTKRLQEIFPYLAKARCGVGNWWQLVYVCGAILGGAISALSSDTWGKVKGATPVTSFFGGLMMAVGARFAAGCTSGHGLSGVGMLAFLSFIAVPFMFGGAIITAFSMQATGALSVYEVS